MTARTTIIVTQRERFGMTEESLDDLYDKTDTPFELIYVDGNSPRKTAEYLKGASARRGFKLIRREHFLTPNQARNIGVAAATTPYVVFIDNDVLFTEGWLAALEKAADETRAAIVAPLICHALPAHTTIHHAGGDFAEDGAHNAFFAPPPEDGRPFVEIMHGHNEKRHAYRNGELVREETGFCEFHCVLARRDIFDVIGPLDEKLLSTKEHIDFSMSVKAVGEKVVFEPSSVVTYVFPIRDRPLELADWPFFALRWSDSYGRRSLEHFIAKWHLKPPEDYILQKRHTYAGRRIQAILIPMMRKVPGLKASKALTTKAAHAAGLLERRINSALVAYYDARAR